LIYITLTYIITINLYFHVYIFGLISLFFFFYILDIHRIIVSCIYLFISSVCLRSRHTPNYFRYLLIYLFIYFGSLSKLTDAHHITLFTDTTWNGTFVEYFCNQERFRNEVQEFDNHTLFYTTFIVDNTSVYS